MVANGTIGARLHVPFPVLNRSSFGFWFSYFSVISRVILSMFWFGVQTFTGSECVYQVSTALDPCNWLSLKRKLLHVDAQSHLALNRQSPQPPLPRRERHNSRHALLPPLLAHPVPIHVHLAAADPLALRRQGHPCAHRLACDAHMGFRQGSRE